MHNDLECRTEEEDLNVKFCIGHDILMKLNKIIEDDIEINIFIGLKEFILIKEICSIINLNDPKFNEIMTVYLHGKPIITGEFGDHKIDYYPIKN